MTLKQRWNYFFKGWYQKGDAIISENYGSYPAVVDFTPDMTLYPGQSAIVKFKTRRLNNVNTRNK